MTILQSKVTGSEHFCYRHQCAGTFVNLGNFGGRREVCGYRTGKETQNGERRMQNAIGNWQFSPPALPSLFSHERFMAENAASIAAFARAQQVLPGGVNSPVRAFKAVGGSPLFIKEASGCPIKDIEGDTNNAYVP